MHNHHRNVNQFQSKEERRLKYWVAREFGKLSSDEAHRLKDWNWQSIRGYLGNLAYLAGDNANIGSINAICQQGYDTFKGDYQV